MKKWLARTMAFLMVLSLMFPLFVHAEDTVQETRSISILSIAGESVTVNKEGQSPFAAVEKMSLREGQTVTTGSNSYAYLQMDDDKVIKLNQNSAVTISKAASKKLSITLKSGELFFNVKKPLAADSELTFHAGNASMGIRGTSGLLSIEKANVKAMLFTGKAQLVESGGQGRASSSVTLTPGFRATVQPSGRINSVSVPIEKVSAFAVEAVLENKDTISLASLGITPEIENKLRQELPARKEAEAQKQAEKKAEEASQPPAAAVPTPPSTPSTNPPDNGGDGGDGGDSGGSADTVSVKAADFDPSQEQTGAVVVEMAGSAPFTFQMGSKNGLESFRSEEIGTGGLTKVYHSVVANVVSTDTAHRLLVTLTPPKLLAEAAEIQISAGGHVLPVMFRKCADGVYFGGGEPYDGEPTSKLLHIYGGAEDEFYLAETGAPDTHYSEGELVDLGIKLISSEELETRRIVRIQTDTYTGTVELHMGSYVKEIQFEASQEPDPPVGDRLTLEDKTDYISSGSGNVLEISGNKVKMTFLASKDCTGYFLVMEGKEPLGTNPEASTIVEAVKKKEEGVDRGDKHMQADEKCEITITGTIKPNKTYTLYVAAVTDDDENESAVTYSVFTAANESTGRL